MYSLNTRTRARKTDLRTRPRHLASIRICHNGPAGKPTPKWDKKKQQTYKTIG